MKMDVIMRKTEELIPYERNQKKHDEKQIRNIANSIKRFGWRVPLVIDKKDVVVMGHGRLLAAKLLNLQEVPVTVVDDLSEDEIRELRIVDNKTNESPWNYANLDIDTQELDFEGFDFDFMNNQISDEDIDELFTNKDTDEEEDEEEPKKVQCPHCGEWFEV